MTPDAHRTVRNVGSLLLQRWFCVGSAVLFSLIVPRLMGPDAFGRYVLIDSLAFWFVMLGSVGLTQVIGHFAPKMLQEEGGDRLRSFYGSLLTVRLGSGVLAGLAFLGLTIHWLRDIPREIFFVAAGIVFARSVANIAFTFFLGLNRAATWGMELVLRGWATVILVPTGFLLRGLPGAFMGLVLAEAFVMIIGLRWAAPHLELPRKRRNTPLAPYIQFAWIFFLSDVTISAFHSGGEAMVRIFTGDYSQVAYYGLAQRIFLVPALMFPQLAFSFAPLIIGFMNDAGQADIKLWVGRILKGLVTIGIVLVFGVLLLGPDLIPVVFGSAYASLTPILVPMTASLVFLALISVGDLLAITHKRPGIALAAAAIRLTAFWCLGPGLISEYGSLGGCFAFLAASGISAIYLTASLRRIVRYSLAAWLGPVTLGACLLPVVWLRSESVIANAGLYLVFVVAFVTLLMVFRILKMDELALVWQSVTATADREENP